MKIGFIGLGNMGFGMATNVLKAGHKLTVYDIRRKVAEPLLKAGASWAETPKGVAEASEIVCTSLPGPKEVEEVALGPNGIIEGIIPDGVFIDLSTNSPEVVRRLYDKFKAKGAHVMDVPIGDGADEVMSGRLMLMASGDEDIFQRCKSVLDAMGNRVRYFGKIGTGSICKIVHNSLSFGIQTVVAEGFSLGIKAGIEPEDLWWVISQGAVGKGALFHVLMPNVYLPRRFDPPHFALKLAFKDVALATSLGREFNVPMALTTLTLQELMTAMNRGWGDKDSVISMVLQEERAGLKIQNPAESSKLDSDSQSK
jgi:3-hydroxyisobutyrate dehydrogenase-like beta-hydroxyacid dehydrogenase